MVKVYYELTLNCKDLFTISDVDNIDIAVETLFNEYIEKNKTITINNMFSYSNCFFINNTFIIKYVIKIEQKTYKETLLTKYYVGYQFLVDENPNSVNLGGIRAMRSYITIDKILQCISYDQYLIKDIKKNTDEYDELCRKVERIDYLNK